MKSALSLHFPLSDVVLHHENYSFDISGLRLDENTIINQQEFSLTIPSGVHFLAKNGTDIYIKTNQKTDPELINMYLNGSLLAAILHQRKILNFHASAFEENGKAILICGDSEVGKSSLNLAFCLAGKTFLNDDTVPVQFDSDFPRILPLGKQAKIWKDSLKQLQIAHQSLSTVVSEDEKYLYPIGKTANTKIPLKQIFILEICAENALKHQHLFGIEAFQALRQQVYRKEYLVAMPESEISFMHNLLELSKTIPVTRIQRSYSTPIESCKNYLEKLI